MTLGPHDGVHNGKRSGVGGALVTRAVAFHNLSSHFLEHCAFCDVVRRAIVGGRAAHPRELLLHWYLHPNTYSYCNDWLSLRNGIVRRIITDFLVIQ